MKIEVGNTVKVKRLKLNSWHVNRFGYCQKVTEPMLKYVGDEAIVENVTENGFVILKNINVRFSDDMLKPVNFKKEVSV